MLIVICSFCFIGICIYNIATAPIYAEPIYTKSSNRENITIGDTDMIIINTITTDGIIDNSNDNKYNVKILVNINTATIEELISLNGIGEVTALAIIEYRENNGDFVEITDIMKVSGIGEAKFNSIVDDIFI